jgi:hypothetical protein
MDVITQKERWFQKTLVRGFTTISILFSICSSSFGQSRTVYVLLYNSGTANEGIHTIKVDEMNDVVLMFESQADASSFALELEAVNFPKPTVEAINREEIMGFCQSSQLICKVIPPGTPVDPPPYNLPPEQRDYQ